MSQQAQILSLHREAPAQITYHSLIPHLVIDRSYIHGKDALESDTGDEAREAACGSCKPLNEKVMALTQPLWVVWSLW